MNDVLTGSGLADAEELYSREAHRKRALEMYRHTSQQMAAATATSPATISPENSFSATVVSPERSSTALPTLDRSQSGQNSKFSLIMETFQLFQPTTPDVKRKDESKKKRPNEAKLIKNRIRVSGNYIPSPPERLTFARRTGKFHPSTASAERTGVLGEATGVAPGNAPHLRILKDGEQTSSNF